MSVVSFYMGGDILKRPSRIVVRGQSAKEIIAEIENPTMSSQQLELFKKALDVSQKIKKNTNNCNHKNS